MSTEKPHEGSGSINEPEGSNVVPPPEQEKQHEPPKHEPPKHKHDEDDSAKHKRK
jgi:hypothetical protein